jgi:hypothetical protein
VPASNDLLKRLGGRDRRSIGRSNEVAQLVLRRPALFAELIHGMYAADPLVRMRAADAAEKVSLKQPKLLRPFKGKLLRLMEKAEEQELRWHLAQMAPRLPLTSKERLRAAATLRRYLEDRSSIVKTCAMQAVADLAKQNESLVADARALLRGAMRNGTAAMKARARKLLTRFAAS